MRASGALNGVEPEGAALSDNDSGWREELRLWRPDDTEPPQGPRASLSSAPAVAAVPEATEAASGLLVEFTLATPSASGAPTSTLTVMVASSSPAVDFASDAAADVALHWAVAKELGGRWKRVPRGWKTLPDFSIDAGGNAWETAFMQVPQALRGGHSGAAQILHLEFADLSKFGGVVFVLKVKDSGAFLNDGGDDFFVPVTC